MPIQSRWQFDIPDCSLPTLIFGSPTDHLDDTRPLFMDAEKPDHYLTMHGYRRLAQRLAAGLRKRGFKPGDRLLLYSGNNIYFPVVFFGVVMAGGIFTGSNPGYVAREVAYQVDDSGATFLLCARESLDVAHEATKETNFPKDRVFCFDNTPRPVGAKEGIQHWSELLGSEEEGASFAWDPLSKPGESKATVALNYSSGTTGRPKGNFLVHVMYRARLTATGVEITHRNYVANSMIQKNQWTMKDNYAELVADARWLCVTPMYHAMGQTNYCATAAFLGIPTYMMPKFDFIKMMDYVHKYRITTLFLVPPILVAMAKHPDVRKWKWDLSSVRTVASGAAPLGRPACEEFETLWKGTPKEGQINVTQGWGMTEYVSSGGSCYLY
jgi:4-coumarate--CoA ligase